MSVIRLSLTVRVLSRPSTSWLNSPVSSQLWRVTMTSSLPASSARAKIEAGADLVQIYTGLIYKGPALVSDCARALAQR